MAILNVWGGGVKERGTDVTIYLSKKYETDAWRTERRQVKTGKNKRGG